MSRIVPDRAGRDVPEAAGDQRDKDRQAEEDAMTFRGEVNGQENINLNAR